MEKMTLIAHADSKQRLLKALQQIGAVEVISCNMPDVPLACAPESLARLEERLSGVREALEIIRPYDDSKTSFLTPKPPITLAELADMPSRFAEADELIAKIRAFADDMAALKARRQRLHNRITALMPYASFDAPLESVGPGRYTFSLLGTIPADSLEKYDQIRADYAETAYFEDLGSTRDLHSIFVVMLSSVQEALVGELKFLGFAEAYTRELHGTPADIIADAQKECACLEAEAAERETAARELASQKSVLRALEDYLLNEIAREKCFERLSETGMAFVLEGWVVAQDKQKVEDAVLKAAPETYIAFRPPADDEKPPTALHNPRLVTPFEAVTNMYAHPSPRGFDPNLLMAVFYFIIFGMMLGDAAYGAILTIGAFALLKIKKPTGMFRMITTVFMICGISTVFWGLFYDTVFSISGVPAVINPLEGDGAMTSLILCLAIGVVHIIVGIGIGMYMDIKRGQFWAAIFDRFSWIMVIVGGIMMLVGNPVAQAGQYIALTGALILLVTQGRSKKGILRKITGGLASLYGVTSYVSDILSYARIFGMGLATTVIAMVFNTIASLLMGNVVGYIFGLIVLTVGHGFNIAINALGAFVHTARLQYIEFFNKFYEADGRPFRPLQFMVKNHRLEG